MQTAERVREMNNNISFGSNRQKTASPAQHIHSETPKVDQHRKTPHDAGGAEEDEIKMKCSAGKAAVYPATRPQAHGKIHSKK